MSESTPEKSAASWKRHADNVQYFSNKRGQTIVRLQNRLRRWKRRAGRNNGARREWMALAKAWEVRAGEGSVRIAALRFALLVVRAGESLVRPSWRVATEALDVDNKAGGGPELAAAGDLVRFRHRDLWCVGYVDGVDGEAADVVAIRVRAGTWKAEGNPSLEAACWRMARTDLQVLVRAAR